MSIEFLVLVDGAVGLLLVVLGIPLIMEKVKPNRWYGFRTPRTLSDEKIWYPANKYSGKTMVGAGAVMAAASVLLFILIRSNVVKSDSEGAFMAVWGLVMFVPILVMVIASFSYLKKI